MAQREALVIVHYMLQHAATCCNLLHHVAIPLCKCRAPCIWFQCQNQHISIRYARAGPKDDDCFDYHSWRNNVLHSFWILSSFVPVPRHTDLSRTNRLLHVECAAVRCSVLQYTHVWIYIRMWAHYFFFQHTDSSKLFLVRAFLNDEPHQEEQETLKWQKKIELEAWELSRRHVECVAVRCSVLQYIYIYIYECIYVYIWMYAYTSTHYDVSSNKCCSD